MKSIIGILQKKMESQLLLNLKYLQNAFNKTKMREHGLYSMKHGMSAGWRAVKMVMK